MKHLALVLLLLPGVAAADAVDDMAASEFVGGSLHVRAGATTVPFVTAEHPETGSGGVVFVLSGYRHVTTATWVGARIPLASIAVVQPAGSYVFESAFGNVELYVADRRRVGRLGAWVVDVTTRLGAGIPTAQSGTAGGLMENRALTVADALEGFRDHELFVPGIVPITASAQVGVTSGRWSANASAKLPLLLRVSDADLPDAADPQTVGFTPVLGLQGTGWVSQRIGLSLDGHAFLDVAPAVTGVVEPDSVHVVVQPALLWRIGTHALLRVDAVVPVAGPLAGETYAGGVSVLGHL